LSTTGILKQGCTGCTNPEFFLENYGVRVNRPNYQGGDCFKTCLNGEYNDSPATCLPCPSCCSSCSLPFNSTKDGFLTNIVCIANPGFLYDGETNTCTSIGGGLPVVPDELGMLKLIIIQHEKTTLNKLEVSFDEQPQNINYSFQI
jgi:hypothetical protein